MKKLLCILLALSFVFSFVACDDGSSKNDPTTDAPNSGSDESSKNDPTTDAPNNGSDNSGTDSGIVDGNDKEDNNIDDSFVIPADQKVKWVGYLSELLSNHGYNPKSSIPSTMLPEYKTHVVDKDDLITDYGH